MKKTLIFLAAACVALAACQKEVVPSNASENAVADASVIVNIPAISGTKAEDEEIQTADEKKVTRLDIGIYNADGNLEKTLSY